MGRVENTRKVALERPQVQSPRQSCLFIGATSMLASWPAGTKVRLFKWQKGGLQTTRRSQRTLTVNYQIQAVSE